MPVATSSPTGATSRRQLVHNGRAISNLFERTLADGTRRFEFQVKKRGQVSRVTLGATTPTDAIREADRLRVVSADKGIEDGTLRLDSLVARFLDESESGLYVPARGPLAQGTHDLYRQRLNGHTVRLLGGSTRVRDIDTARLRAMIDALRVEELSGSTIRGVVTATAACFRFAVHRGLLRENACLQLDGDLPSGGRQTEPVYLGRAAITALIDSLSDEYRPVIATLAYTGLRISEALGLTWANVDLQAGTLTVEKQIDRKGRERVALKTASSRGTLKLPAPLVMELRAHRARLGERGLDRVTGEALVFQTSSGRSPGRRNSLRALQVQAEKLGIEGANGEKVGLHDLRHSLASTLRGLGWADEQIAPVLRHSNARTTATIYGGLASDSLVSIREAAAEALG